ncbi:MAG: glycosyltransferase [Alphaproteobacteria bacterium]
MPPDAAPQRLRLLQAIAGGEHGGAERFFVRLVGALARAGVEQRVLLRRGRSWADEIEGLGVPVCGLGFGGALDVTTRHRFARQVEGFAPRIVLTWMSRATRFCPRSDGGRRFVHAARLGGYYDLKYYRHCDHLIGNTLDLVRYFRANDWPAERSHYLPNFVDATPAAPASRAALDTPEDARVVLALGRLHRNKAYDVLLRALARLPDVVLWLAGEGPERSRLEAMAEELGVARRVRWLGWRADVGALMAACDVFACPSRIEPLGNVVIEAWAHGAPVAAAASVGPAALIASGETGLLVPVEDHEALANSVRVMLDNPALAARLSEAGRKAYEASFTEAAVVSAYLRFFERVAAPCAASPG